MEIDLSKVPWEALKAEYERRKAIRKEERQKAKLEAKVCRNCAHRIMANTSIGGQFVHETWVCEVNPKQDIRSYSGNKPRYTISYRACNHFLALDCDSFVNIRSEEGKKMIKERLSMANRMSDDDY